MPFIKPKILTNLMLNISSWHFREFTRYSIFASDVEISVTKELVDLLCDLEHTSTLPSVIELSQKKTVGYYFNEIKQGNKVEDGELVDIYDRDHQLQIMDIRPILTGNLHIYEGAECHLK